jgi:hypothetical protein
MADFTKAKKYCSMESLKESVAEEHDRMNDSKCKCGGTYVKIGHSTILPKDQDSSEGSHMISRILAMCIKCKSQKEFDTPKIVKLYMRPEQN